MNTDGQEHLRHGGYIKEERNNLGAAVGKPKTFAFRATPLFGWKIGLPEKLLPSVPPELLPSVPLSPKSYEMDKNCSF